MTIDRSYFQNPVSDYLRWLKTKLVYERSYKKEKLRIGYMTTLRNVSFGSYNWTGSRVHLENVSVGDFTYFSDDSVILEAKIGKYCSFGPNVKVAPGKHPTHTFVSTHPALFSNPTYCKKNFFNTDHHHPNREVTIGNDVWICANVVISDGVTIGDGAIIGANTVVARNVEPYTIVSGNPAQVVRKRFEEDEIEFLNSVKWWDKDFEWLEKNSQYFLNIKDFVHLNQK
jgi:acetyltransferase-like isoleucine patch superfamily enzyme